MGAEALSFSTAFNQQKYLINDSYTATIPSSVVAYDLILTIPTGLTKVPSFRTFVEIAGILYPILNTFDSPLNFTTTTGVDPNFNFVIKTFNSGAPLLVTFYYRIYEDSAP